jgi:trimeric autotransporter adhesin
MNSFKKKVILAVSAALVGSFTVVAPTFANVPTIAVSVNAVADNDANTLAGAAVVAVPADNRVDLADTVRFALTGVLANSVLSVTATKATLITTLNALGAPVTSASGSSSLSVSVGTGTTADFYAYTKTTEVGSVTITTAGNTFVYYLKGTAGTAYNLDATVASSVNTSSVVENVIKVTDVFGNAVSAVTPVITVIGATVETAATASDTNGVSKFSTRYPLASGQAAISAALPGVISDVDGMPAAAKSTVKFVTVSDLATEVVRLRTELATEKSTSAAALALANKALADAKIEYDAALVAARANTSKEVAAALAAAEAAKKAADIAVTEAKNAANTDINTAKAAAEKAVKDAVAAKVAAEVLAVKAVTDTTTAVKDLSAMLDKVIAESKVNADSSKKAFDEAIAAQKDLLAATKTSSNAEINTLKAEIDKINNMLKSEVAKSATSSANNAALRKAFNDLAKRWNAKNPKSKVALR